MGQVLGRAPLLPVARHYVNGLRTSVEIPPSPFADTHARVTTRYLPQSQARACTTYGRRSTILGGMGLTSDETCEILRVCLKDVLGYAEKKLDALSRSLFVALDDDQNELIDALEFLAALGALSGMSQEQKITFIFGIFDFDESGVLTVDETIRVAIDSLGTLQTKRP